MRRPRHLLTGAGIAAVVAVGAVVPAQADFGAPSLVSFSPREQADRVGTSALSADGRFLAWSGSLGGITGILRTDRGTGLTTPVAAADAYDPGARLADASMPSISADGRYVSFTTTAALDPVHDHNAVSDVYVRDMDLPAPGATAGPGASDAGACPVDAPCAFALASAVDGAPDGLAYDETGEGSVAAPRSALSADGRTVAFVVQAASDLVPAAGEDSEAEEDPAAGEDPEAEEPGSGEPAPGEPEPPALPTPGGQVAVRDLDTFRTTLVSSLRDPDTGAMTGEPVPGGAVTSVLVDPGRADTGHVLPVAALSADGTSVAWLGANVALQAPTLADEHLADIPRYDEPLWRRVAGGAGGTASATRRVVGGGDPTAAGCGAEGTLADAACRGPYPSLVANSESTWTAAGWLTEPGLVNGLPALSADGRTVALLGGPPLAGDSGPAVQDLRSQNADLFLVDMRDGLARRDAVRRLTEAPDVKAVKDRIFDVGLAPDGRRVAFATARREFALTPPFLLGRPPALAGVTELYLVDLAGQSLQRVSVPSGPGPSLGPPALSLDGATGAGAGSPTFDVTGRMLAFDSEAANLLPADADANAANDAFVVTELPPPPAATPGRVDISAPPAPLRFVRAWRIALRAVAQRDGSVRLDADAPGAGLLRVTVRATVRVTRKVRVVRGGRRRTITERVLARRQVAVAALPVAGAAVVRLPVRTTRAYRPLVRAKGGLDATATVTFAAPGRPTLRETMAVRFRSIAARKPAPQTAGAKAPAPAAVAKGAR